MCRPSLVFAQFLITLRAAIKEKERKEMRMRTKFRNFYWQRYELDPIMCHGIRHRSVHDADAIYFIVVRLRMNKSLEITRIASQQKVNNDIGNNGEHKYL